MIHRIYRTCSSWQLIDKAIEEAKIILYNNQYPPSFVENIINITLNKIITRDVVERIDTNETIEDDNKSNDHDDDVNETNVSIDSNIFSGEILEKDKFRFYINYRGMPTEKLVQSLYRLRAPCKVIMTLNKTKSVISSLKFPVPDMLKSNVVYKITCSRCQSSYVGQTSRHLQQRFREHIGSKGILRKHFEECNITPSDDLVKIIGTSRFLDKLLTLEALFIEEIKPELNTKDEYRSRTLKLKF